jgi:hypothetical protein
MILRRPFEGQLPASVVSEIRQHRETPALLEVHIWSMLHPVRRLSGGQLRRALAQANTCSARLGPAYRALEDEVVFQPGREGVPEIIRTAQVQAEPIAQPDSGLGGIWSHLADIGHGPGRSTAEVSTRLATQEESSFLGLTAPAPVFYLVRTAFDSEERPVEICEHVMSGERWPLE